MPQDRITQLLQRWSQGDQEAADEILPLVYGELRRIAESHFRRERPGHTLQATVLVHEAWLSLAETNELDWQSRTHFYGVAAHLIRRILVDHARKHNRLKRGSGALHVTLDEAMEVAVERPPELIDLDDALERLASLDSRKAKVVELRFFAGLSVEEIAEVLAVSVKTVWREWRGARAWLLDELTQEGASNGR